MCMPLRLVVAGHTRCSPNIRTLGPLRSIRPLDHCYYVVYFVCTKEPLMISKLLGYSGYYVMPTPHF